MGKGDSVDFRRQAKNGEEESEAEFSGVPVTQTWVPTHRATLSYTKI